MRKLTDTDLAILRAMASGLGCLASDLDKIDHDKTKRRYRLSWFGYCYYDRFCRAPFEPMLWKLTEKGREVLEHENTG
jgi:hypothetical protein